MDAYTISTSLFLTQDGWQSAGPGNGMSWLSIVLFVIAALAIVGLIVLAVRNRKAGDAKTGNSANIANGKKTKLWFLVLVVLALVCASIGFMCGCTSPGAQKQTENIKNTEVDLTYASQITGNVDKSGHIAIEETTLTNKGNTDVQLTEIGWMSNNDKISGE